MESVFVNSGLDSRVSLLGSFQTLQLCRRSHPLSFPFHRHGRFSVSACSADEPWRTWIASETKQTKGFSLLFGSNPLSLEDRRAPGLPPSIQEFFPCFGRCLLIIGLGLSFSLPACAQTLAPSTSTISVDSSSDGVKVVENDATLSMDKTMSIDATRVVVSDHKQHESAASAERRDGASSHSNAMTFEASLKLSEAFWKGIPTPEGSSMESLKLQLSNHPDDSKALEFLLGAVMEKRDMLRALTVLEILHEVQPENLKWRFLKARTHEFLGEYAMAKMGYEELVNRRPLSARFIQGLVMLLDKLGEGAQALEVIRGAMEKAQSQQKIAEARNLGILLSQFYIQLGNFDNALQQLNVMIDEDPDDFRPYLCQGLAYTLMNQTDKAAENFKKYQQLCPPDSLEQSYLDELMLAAKVDRQNDAILKAALKSSFKKRKKTTIMQQPAVSGRVRTDQQSSNDS